MPDTIKRSGARSRLAYLESRVFWTGSASRNDVARRFGASPAQITQDLRMFVEAANAAGGEIINRRGVLTGRLPAQPLFGEFDFNEWVTLESRAGAVTYADVGSLTRASPPATIRQIVLGAMVGHRAIEVDYVSLTSGEGQPRVICPHALVRADGRLHVRAFDNEKHRFADFVLTRIRSCSYSDMPWVGQEADAAWHNLCDIIITADPSLEIKRRRIVEFEFGIPEDGERLIPVRTALVFYALVQFDLLAQNQRESRYHLVCRNYDELKARAEF